jgi:hypothetical protein
MGNCNTDHSRQLRNTHAKLFRERIIAEGGGLTTVLLKKEQNNALKKLVAHFGSKQKAIEHAIDTEYNALKNNNVVI